MQAKSQSTIFKKLAERFDIWNAVFQINSCLILNCMSTFNENKVLFIWRLHSTNRSANTYQYVKFIGLTIPKNYLPCMSPLMTYFQSAVSVSKQVHVGDHPLQLACTFTKHRMKTEICFRKYLFRKWDNLFINWSFLLSGFTQSGIMFKFVNKDIFLFH